MKLRLLALTLCLFICIFCLASCAEKYKFEYAFFPMGIVETSEDPRDFSSDEIDEAYISLVEDYLISLTSFINKKFGLNISKPMPVVKSYTPNYDALASYCEGTMYLCIDAITDDEAYGIVHELVHYLSDNNGYVGFIHKLTVEDSSINVGFGLTEGLTELITIMYCVENSIPLPERIIEDNDYYIYNRNLAEVYYALEPKVMDWLFKGDHESMTNFVKTNLNDVAIIPSEYSNATVFDLHFYAYQDILMDTMTGIIEDEYSFRLMYTASFEMAAVTVRACSDKELKNRIYEEILINHDQNYVVKNMVFA